MAGGNQMFDAYGRPKGSDQISPYQSQPKPAGEPPPDQAQAQVQEPPPPGPVNHAPPDPTFTGWRKGSNQRQLGDPHSGSNPDSMMGTQVQAALSGVQPPEPKFQPQSFLAGDQFGKPGNDPLMAAITGQTANAAEPPTSQPGHGSDQWIEFTNQLAGYGGEGGAFDASAGRSGASDAAHAARGNLQGIVDQYNQKYGHTAKVVNGDRIDFEGNGQSSEDVIRDAGNGQDGFWRSGPGGGGGDSGGGGDVPRSASVANPMTQQTPGTVGPMPEMNPLLQALSGSLPDSQYSQFINQQIPGGKNPGSNPQDQQAVLAAILQQLQQGTRLPQ